MYRRIDKTWNLLYCWSDSGYSCRHPYTLGNLGLGNVLISAPSFPPASARMWARASVITDIQVFALQRIGFCKQLGGVVVTFWDCDLCMPLRGGVYEYEVNINLTYSSQNPYLDSTHVKWFQTVQITETRVFGPWRDDCRSPQGRLCKHTSTIFIIPVHYLCH